MSVQTVAAKTNISAIPTPSSQSKRSGRFHVSLRSSPKQSNDQTGGHRRLRWLGRGGSDETSTKKGEKKGDKVLMIRPTDNTPVAAEYKGLRKYTFTLEKSPDVERVKELQYSGQDVRNINTWRNSQKASMKGCPLLYCEGKKPCFVFGDYPEQTSSSQDTTRSRHGSIKNGGGQTQQSSSRRSSSIK